METLEEEVEFIDHDRLDLSENLPGIIALLGQLGSGAIITEEGIGRLFGRHADSVKRAVDRGELPTPVKMFGKPTWTVGILLNHINARLAKAATEADQEQRRLAHI
jgi:hypothetical protein